MGMRQSDEPSFLYATRIDILLEIRAYLIALLTQTLACTVDLRSQVKHAAWNVKGAAFLQLRALFDAMPSTWRRTRTWCRNASWCWAGWCGIEMQLGA
jgi:hypothetical protein